MSYGATAVGRNSPLNAAPEFTLTPIISTHTKM